MFTTYEIAIIVILTILFIVLSLSPLMDNKEDVDQEVPLRTKRQRPASNHASTPKVRSESAFRLEPVEKYYHREPAEEQLVGSETVAKVV